MPNITLANGRRHYVNPFNRFCDLCERNDPSDWIMERDRYECDACQKDIAFEAAMAADYAEDEAPHVDVALVAAE